MAACLCKDNLDYVEMCLWHCSCISSGAHFTRTTCLWSFMATVCINYMYPDVCQECIRELGIGVLLSTCLQYDLHSTAIGPAQQQPDTEHIQMEVENLSFWSL